MLFLTRLWFRAVQQNQKGFIWSIIRLLIRLLSCFYLVVIKLRLFFYKIGIIIRIKLSAYVISVGNITVGGTGKTPFVMYLSEKLSQKGKVGIISRGYGRSPNHILDDESFTLTDNVVRATNPNRYKAGKELIETLLVKIIILDDGFQHLRLKRDLDMVLIDATNPFGNERVLPAGILREPLSSLKRADIFVITHTDLVISEQLSELESKLSRYNKKIIKTIHKPHYLVLINQTPNKIVEISEIKNKNVWGFCGIGNPYQFHKTLNLLCNVKGFSIFPDHYYYSANDLSIIFNKVKDEKVEAFITTEKDALRLQNITIPDELPVYYLKIKMEVTDGENIIQGIERIA
ncbi:MAG: tetraacyldisaccharide 4'-kinase [Planctomycetota bacterium]